MITIVGDADDPASMGEANAVFKFKALTNEGGVYIGSVANVVCDSDGAYSSPLNNGKYEVMADFGGGFKRVGVATVTDSTPATVELSEIL